MRQNGVSTMELTTLTILIIAVLIAFNGYIKRGMSGHWKTAGDALGQGRQYDPRSFGAQGEGGGTLDCFFDTTTNAWVDEKCYADHGCDCTLVRFDGIPLSEYQVNCIDCKAACQTLSCQGQ